MELRGVNASNRVIATARNDSGHRPKRAKRWSPMTVKRIYDRETKRASPLLKDTLVATFMGTAVTIVQGQPVGRNPAAALIDYLVTYYILSLS